MPFAEEASSRFQVRSPWICDHSHLFSQFSANPPATAAKPNPGRVDRQLKQTFNAFHSVAREGGLSQLTSANLTVTKVLVPPPAPAASSSRRHLKSSTVSSTNSSTSSCGSHSGNSSGNSSISISILAQHAALAAHPFLFQSSFAASQLSASPFLSEAISAVSNHILPSQVGGHFPLLSSASAFGPMTRLRKRKMAERSDDDVTKLEAPLLGSALLPGRTFVDPYDHKKRLKPEVPLASAAAAAAPASGYYSVSVTRVPAAAAAAASLSNPCSRTFQSTRTPTITID
jgi:hypothetical protein